MFQLEDIVAHADWPDARGVVREVFHRNGVEHCRVEWVYHSITTLKIKTTDLDRDNCIPCPSVDLILKRRGTRSTPIIRANFLDSIMSEPGWGPNA